MPHGPRPQRCSSSISASRDTSWKPTPSGWSNNFGGPYYLCPLTTDGEPKRWHVLGPDPSPHPARSSRFRWATGIPARSRRTVRPSDGMVQKHLRGATRPSTLRTSAFCGVAVEGASCAGGHGLWVPLDQPVACHTAWDTACFATSKMRGATKHSQISVSLPGPFRDSPSKAEPGERLCYALRAGRLLPWKTTGGPYRTERTAP